MVVLIAAVLYVSAVNDVTARKSELAQVTASAASWQAAANSYASLRARPRSSGPQQLADVRQLADAAGSRGPSLLSQIGGADAGQRGAELAAGDLSVARRRRRHDAAPRRHRRGPDGPAAPIRAAPRPSPLSPQTMVQLGRVHGVSAVTLASSTDSSGAGLELGAPRLAAPRAAAVRSRCPFHCRCSRCRRPSARPPARPSARSTSTTPAATPAASTTYHPDNRSSRPMSLRPRDRIALGVVLVLARSSARSTCWPSSPSARRPSRWSPQIAAQQQAARAGAAELCQRPCGTGVAEVRRRASGPRSISRSRAVRHPGAAAHPREERQRGPRRRCRRSLSGSRPFHQRCTDHGRHRPRGAHGGAAGHACARSSSPSPAVTSRSTSSSAGSTGSRRGLARHGPRHRSAAEHQQRDPDAARRA